MRLIPRFGFSALLLGASATTALSQIAGVSLAEVVALRGRGVSDRQILRYAQEYCISFVVTDSVERVLKSAGADTVLMAALRATCTTDAPLNRGSAAHVLDVTFSDAAGQPGFVAEDRSCSARFLQSGLVIDNKRRNDVCVTDYPSDSLPDSVAVVLTVGGLGASPDGLAILGLTAGGGASRRCLIVVGGHRIRVEWSDDSGTRPLLERWLEGVALNASGLDSVRVEIRRRDLSISVNGRAVAAASVPEVVREGLMLGVGPHGTILFTRLRATRLEAGSLAKR